MWGVGVGCRCGLLVWVVGVGSPKTSPIQSMFIVEFKYVPAFYIPINVLIDLLSMGPEEGINLLL